MRNPYTGREEDDPDVVTSPAAVDVPMPTTNPDGTPTGQPAGYQGLEYWQAQGLNPQGANGGLAPGFSRTANGYGYTAPGGNVGPFTGQFTAPTRGGLPGLPDVPDAPQPNLPTYTPPPAWKAPSIEEAMNDPGYKFRVQQGNASLQRWAAAKGTLNDTGTANALEDYGQNSGSQEYQNVWNRDFDAYKTNTQTQYVDPYKFNYQRALDTTIPQWQEWQAKVDMSKLGYSTQAANAQHVDDMSYMSAWNQFLNGQDLWKYNTDNAISLAAA